MLFLEILFLLFGLFGIVWFSRQLHEYSHYFAGRQLGIPKDKIKVRFENKSSSVALFDGSAWLTPDDPAYASLFQSYNSEPFSAWLFIAAGMVGETLVMMTLSILLLLFNLPLVALVLFGVSTLLLIIYFVVDVIQTYKSSKPAGDLTAMRAIFRMYTYILVVTIITLRAMLLIIIGVFSLVSLAA